VSTVNTSQNDRRPLLECLIVMSADLSKSLVIGISSRALFDLEDANDVFEKDGVDAYTKYQLANEDVILKAGTGFRLVEAILALNGKVRGDRKAEVVVTSRNSPATAMRLFNSIERYGLDITRVVLTGGTPVPRYLKPFSVDLYLSAYESDVQEVIRSGIAAAVIYHTPREAADPFDVLRIAFDGDNVLFGSESEDIYQSQGLDGFVAYERRHERRPLADGPFAKLFRTLALLQRDNGFDNPPIRTALITARSMPTHIRVLNTFRAWGINVDEAFFMGGVSKTGILEAFRPHIFFDDQDAHCRPASAMVPTARVPVAIRTEIVNVLAPPSPDLSSESTTKPDASLGTESDVISTDRSRSAEVEPESELYASAIPNDHPHERAQ
jgi:5'-nucleotidase